MIRIYIGYDAAFGDAAYRVCEASIREHASEPVCITPIRQDWLRRIGLYRRQFYVEEGQQYDAQDGRPFSTEFAFSRFLVPSLQPDGWALWCDSDFMFRADVAELWEQRNKGKAAMCVQHDYKPEQGTKMTGQQQQGYKRKNWSSLMLWNCEHPASRMLTPYMVNQQSGRWLHQLAWLTDDEIGALPEEWNWLDGHSPADMDPKAVHFTRGTPDMPQWADTQYAAEWTAIWGGLE